MSYYSENLYFFKFIINKKLINEQFNLFYYLKLSIIIIYFLMTRSNGLVLLSFFIIQIFKSLFSQINQKEKKCFTNMTL